MHFERLSQKESVVVGEALRAAADGPFFPDWEFQILFGLRREVVRRIADEWPLPRVPAEEVELAVNNAMNLLLGYPHRNHELWSEWISVDQKAFEELFSRIRGRESN